MRDLNDICRLSDSHLTGNETFTLNGSETGMTILEYWRWHYSEIFDLQDSIAEYIVGKALGLTEAQNVGSWTLFDMLYRNKRIEIKETSYYHAWQTDEEKKSSARAFSITKSFSRYQDNTSTLERQNDIYIFCLNTGETRKDSNPLQLEHWEFYVIPTSVINRECGDGKTISLSRVRKIASPTCYNDLKKEIDRIIEENW